jgi:hypothetical protein
VALLEAMIGDSPTISPEEKSVVDKYRHIHVIDDRRHTDALARCGWTEKEYEEGCKAGDAAASEEHAILAGQSRW